MRCVISDTMSIQCYTVCSHIFTHIKLREHRVFSNLYYQRSFVFGTEQPSLQSTYIEIYGVQIFTFVFSRPTRKPVKLSTLGRETDPLHIKHLPQTRCKNSTVSNYCINRPGNSRLWQKSNTQEQNMRHLKGITINTLTARPSDQKGGVGATSLVVLYTCFEISRFDTAINQWSHFKKCWSPTFDCFSVSKTK